MPINANVSNLPSAPNRSGSPNTFTSDTDAFLAALPTLQSEINAYAAAANSTGDQISEYLSAAEQGAVTGLDVARWDSEVTYSRFDPVIGSDGNTYRSLVDNNLGNDPTTDGGDNWLNLSEVSLAPILKPELLSPTDGATDIGETPTLDAGNYYSLYGRPHTLSRFQVASDQAFTSIVYDSGEIAATQTHTVPAGNLQEGQVTYYWRAYYEDDAGNQSDFSDPFEFVTASTFFDPEDPANIGQSFAGGFLVGIIDTVAGTIDSQDAYQTGERYALVVAPKSLEGGANSSPAAGLTTGVLEWDTQARGIESGSVTRWNGLQSTNTILAKNDPSYEVFSFIEECRTQYPAPSISGGSEWYLPAMDELELIYRNLKPVTADNSELDDTRGFPSITQNSGFNPSSDPTGSAYTATGEPFQTGLTEFQVGGAEAVDLDRYWTSTDSNNGNTVWGQNFTLSGVEGRQRGVFTKNSTSPSVRPVRRVLL